MTYGNWLKVFLSVVLGMIIRTKRAETGSWKQSYYYLFAIADTLKNEPTSNLLVLLKVVIGSETTEVRNNIHRIKYKVMFTDVMSAKRMLRDNRKSSQLALHLSRPVFRKKNPINAGLMLVRHRVVDPDRQCTQSEVSKYQEDTIIWLNVAPPPCVCWYVTVGYSCDYTPGIIRHWIVNVIHSHNRIHQDDSQLNRPIFCKNVLIRSIVVLSW